MKKFGWYFRWGFIALFPLLFGGCSDRDDPAQGELSPFVTEYLGLRNSGQESAMRQQSAAVNQSFRNLQGAYHEISGSEPGSPDAGDTAVWNDPWFWETCAEVSEIRNDDGSQTLTYDYGDGCEEGWGDYRYTMHGRYSSTWKYSDYQEGSIVYNSYLYNTLYENYGGSYYGEGSSWSIDGQSDYAGESHYDTTDFSFEGWYEWDDRTSYRYDEESYDYTSSGKTKYDSRGSVTESAEYEYSTGPDYYYKSIVLKPLVSDYTCNSDYYRSPEEGGDDRISLWVYSYVSGIEKVDYLAEGKTGSFVIDYGDGKCDNIIYVTENGVTVRVDLGDQGPIPFAAGR
jgi:hypothetical protein